MKDGRQFMIIAECRSSAITDFSTHHRELRREP
jgi:hypothetical protein